MWMWITHYLLIPLSSPSGVPASGVVLCLLSPQRYCTSGFEGSWFPSGVDSAGDRLSPVFLQFSVSPWLAPLSLRLKEWKCAWGGFRSVCHELLGDTLNDSRRINGYVVVLIARYLERQRRPDWKPDKSLKFAWRDDWPSVCILG